ncbi:MAG TPA: hypothetical protein VF173_28525 [Thermoanaerobaculia bacterium]|nr:hypothetical protein [Thermoanaerobaculia bacterium]
MKLRTLIVSAVLSLSLLVALAPAALASVATFTFPNKTGKQVNDLHIEFVEASTPNPPAGPFGPFKNDEIHGNAHNFSNGTVAVNGTVTLTFTNDSPKVKIKEWWWTIDGTPEGGVHTGAP